MDLARRLALVMAFAVAGMTVTAGDAGAAFKYIRSFGSGNGMQAGPGQLSTPQGTGFAPASGDVYVADSMNDRVQEFRPGGAFRRLFGGTGSMAGQFHGPNGLGVAGGGDIYVADGGNMRVQQFTSSRSFIRAFGTFTSSPSNLAVAPMGGGVYVADGGFIHHYTNTGVPIGSFGGTGPAPGQFNSTVSGLAVGPDGDVFAGDYSGARVVEFTAGGTYIRSLANSGQAGVVGPIGVGQARNGHIFVSDNGHERAIELLANGSFVRAFGNAGAGKLDNPGQLSVDCAGNVYVSDIDAGRVREYGNPAAPLPPCRPAVSKFRLKPKSFRSGHKSSFRYRLNEDAKVTISIDGAGKLKQRSGHAGANRQAFSGRVNGNTLAPGSYRATIVAKANGFKSKARHFKFTVT